MTNLASRIVEYIQTQGYQIFTNPQEYNIVYIEGMNPDGTLNDDAPNEFNDLRMVIEFIGDIPKIVNCWKATTEPGTFYTHHPMNPKGAARIAFGQYEAWRVGIHGNVETHEALVQVAPVTVHRDFNRDLKRTGDKIEKGLFGINQHWGYNYPITNISKASAGCLVGRTRDGHKEFMRIIKQDKRYLEDKNFVFTTTIIAGDKMP